MLYIAYFNGSLAINFNQWHIKCFIFNNHATLLNDILSHVIKQNKKVNKNKNEKFANYNFLPNLK